MMIPTVLLYSFCLFLCSVVSTLCNAINGSHESQRRTCDFGAAQKHQCQWHHLSEWCTPGRGGCLSDLGVDHILDQWMLISGCLSVGICQIRYTWNKQVYSRNKSSQMISHATPYIYLYISILNKRIFPYMLVFFMVRLSLVIFQYYWNKASETWE